MAAPVEPTNLPIPINGNLQAPPSGDNAAPAIAPVEKSKPENSVEVKAETAKNEPKITQSPADDQFVLRGSFGLGVPALTQVGGPNGGLFNADTGPANANGDYYFFDTSLQADFRIARLFSDNASLFVGVYGRYSAHRGNLNTGGSYMNLGGAGLAFSLDWKNSMSDWPLFIPSRLAFMGGLFTGEGETTAGNHFSVSDTSGIGFNLRAEADLLGLKLNDSGDSISFGWFGETFTIPNARGDAAYPGWATGPLLSLALVYPGASRIETRTEFKTCKADEFTLEEKIQNLKALQDEVANNIIQLNAMGKYLQESYGWSSEKITTVLQGTWVEYLTYLEKQDPKYQGKSPIEIQSAIAALQADFKAQAKNRYPDGADHFDYPLPESIDLSTIGALPTECEAREGLDDRLNQSRDALLEAKHRVDERRKYLPLLSFLGEGSPINVIGGLSLVNFPPINFLAGKPDYGIVNDGPDGAKKTQMDRIEKFYAANKARIDAGNFFEPTDPQMLAAFKGIFAGNELPLLKNVVDQLTGKKDLKGVREAGLDPEKQKQLVTKIPLLVAAYVSITDGSTPNNGVLADNRARAVELAMILMGMPAERIRSEGRGESDPVVPETLDGSKGGKRVKNLSWAREKNRRVEFMPDFARLKSMNEAPKAPQAETPKTPAEAPQAAPKIEAVPTAPEKSFEEVIDF